MSDDTVPSPPEDAARAADDRPRLGEYVPEGALVDGSAILDRFMRWTADVGLTLYPAQEEALLEVMSGQHVILSTPTGSGKSLVALGLHYMAVCQGKRSYYTAPIKALVSEKFFDLCEAFGAEQVGMLTGDASINWSAPIICCTAEVLASMAISSGERTDAPCVVMDEFHYYGDRDRGVAWQIPLLELPRTQLLLMSATLGDTSDIERRIEDVTGRAVSRVHSDERPVPLDFSYAETAVHETVESLLQSRKAPIYIVHFTQREAAEQAQALTSAQITDKDEKRAVLDAIAGFKFDSPYGKDVRRMLGHGIGLHHAGLLPKYRLLVERLAQQGLLKVICGTDTLGVGVNVPIRSVLFSKLCKFDGEKTAILSVRDFKQIAGRAGRKGFDDAGSVVVQAPEHVTLNKKLEAKAQQRPGKKKVVKKKPPTRGYVAWNEATLERLVESPPETLESRFRLDHGLLIGCLKASGVGGVGGYRRVLDLIDRCHEPDASKPRLRREAAALFRSLRTAGVVDVTHGPAGAEVRVSEDLDPDFSLHHALSLYLVEAASALDPTAETTPVDVLAFTDSILENPRPILIAMEKRARGEAVAAMKAEGLDYDERMERLEKVTYPKPNEALIYETFELFRDAHPWVGREAIRPKGVAREMFDVLAAFDDYVKRMGIAKIEGVLLRYLGQVHDTLARSLPAPLRTPAVQEMIGYFRALIARVDTSLLQEWEKLVHPEEKDDAEGAARAAREYDLAQDVPALRARIRSEAAGLLRALSQRELTDAAERLRARPEGPWTAPALDEALSAYFAEFETIRFDPAARQGHYTVIEEAGPRRWRVRQVLLDERDEGVFYLDLEVDLTHDLNPEGPILGLRGIES